MMGRMRFAGWKWQVISEFSHIGSNFIQVAGNFQFKSMY